MGVVASTGRRRSAAVDRALGVELPPRFRPSVEAVRATLTGREQTLFDLLCLAGHLGKSLPNSNANSRSVSGSRDPRLQMTPVLTRMRSGSDRAWGAAGKRLLPRLLRILTTRNDEEAYRSLRVLLGNASIALAPDCAVPTDPALLVAWKLIVELFPRLYPSAVEPLGRLAWIGPRELTALVRETREGKKRGRLASGMRPGLAGRTLAVDPRLMTLVGKALGTRARPGFEARYIFYSRDGDYFWPHPDDPEYAVNVLVCLEHERPRHSGTASALLAYRPDGSVERYEIPPGYALAFEARGVVHAREPMRRGERVTMLSIAVNTGARRAARPRP